MTGFPFTFFLQPRNTFTVVAHVKYSDAATDRVHTFLLGKIQSLVIKSTSLVGPTQD